MGWSKPVCGSSCPEFVGAQGPSQPGANESRKQGLTSGKLNAGADQAGECEIQVTPLRSPCDE